MAAISRLHSFVRSSGTVSHTEDRLKGMEEEGQRESTFWHVSTR